MDCEGVALRNGEVLASYEGLHRVDVYPDPGFAQSGPVATLPLLIPVTSLRGNRGLETIAVSPKDSPLAGGVTVVSELSFDANGNLLAAVLDGPRKGIFGVVRKGAVCRDRRARSCPMATCSFWNAASALPRASACRSAASRGDDIKPGAVVDGDILLNADMGYQIDNMEGLDVNRRTRRYPPHPRVRRQSLDS